MEPASDAGSDVCIRCGLRSGIRVAGVRRAAKQAPPPGRHRIRIRCGLEAAGEAGLDEQLIDVASRCGFFPLYILRKKVYNAFRIEELRQDEKKLSVVIPLNADFSA